LRPEPAPAPRWHPDRRLRRQRQGPISPV